MLSMLFDELYYKNDREGLLKLFFCKNEGKDILYFDGGGFSFLRIGLEYDSLLKYSFEQELTHKKRILDIRENEDLFFVLRMDDDVFIKIFFWPDSSYPNGVVQTFKVYLMKDENYHSLIEDFEQSDVLDFPSA